MAQPYEFPTWAPYAQTVPGLPIQDDRPSPGHYARGEPQLEIVQEPEEALLAFETKLRGRRPVDPPPIVKLVIDTQVDPVQNFMISPYLFMIATLHKADEDEPAANNALLGALSSSLHRLKNVDNKDGAYFVFGDISVKQIGEFRLRFNLFDLDKVHHVAVWIGDATSKPFKVVPHKDWRGLKNSTFLSRAFSDQGVKLRLRKEASSSKRSYSEMTERPTPHMTEHPIAQSQALSTSSPHMQSNHGNARDAYANGPGLQGHSTHMREMLPSDPRKRFRSDHNHSPVYNTNFPIQSGGVSETRYASNAVQLQPQYAMSFPPQITNYGVHQSAYGMGQGQAATSNPQPYGYPIPPNDEPHYSDHEASQTSGANATLNSHFVPPNSLYPNPIHSTNNNVSANVYNNRNGPRETSTRASVNSCDILACALAEKNFRTHQELHLLLPLVRSAATHRFGIICLKPFVNNTNSQTPDLFTRASAT